MTNKNKILPFNKSNAVSLGSELELQIIDPMNFDLISRAKELIRNIESSQYQKIIKPEITQSMIEINSHIHQSPREMYNEFLEIKSFLLAQAKILGVYFSGGGTHPFQKWALRKIFPTRRFKNKSKLYQYLSKRSTVFGQHIHIGCENGDDAIYLTHALARYVPQLIAISASSPFYQGVDTGFNSSRSNVFSSFPLSGVIPYILSWEEFSTYYYKMKELGIIETMKDFYWDIRPKPEFGTVEIRVCDTPLTFKKAINIVAYIQTIAHYLLRERPVLLSRNLYDLYSYNRFQACRYGFDGDFIDSVSLKHSVIADDILSTIKKIENSANQLNNMIYITQIFDDVLKKNNDAAFLRHIQKQYHSLTKVVHEQCSLWATD